MILSCCLCERVLLPAFLHAAPPLTVTLLLWTRLTTESSCCIHRESQTLNKSLDTIVWSPFRGVDVWKRLMMPRTLHNNHLSTTRAVPSTDMILHDYTLEQNFLLSVNSGQTWIVSLGVFTLCTFWREISICCFLYIYPTLLGESSM